MQSNSDETQSFEAFQKDLSGGLYLADPSFPSSVVHGFTTRLGGVSQGRYASLNLSPKWGDEANKVRENWDRLASASGLDLHRFVRMKQVHGKRVADAGQMNKTGAIGSDEAQKVIEADAIVMHRDDADGRVIGVYTADCIPLLLVDSDAQIVAACHSGWRGTVAGIAKETVQTMLQKGVKAENLFAAIGPCIEVESFEVGPEVAEQFDESFVRTDPKRWGEKAHIDLVGVVRQQLIDSGVPKDQISRVGQCTYRHPDRYFSYRRDGGGIGQQLAFIAFSS